MIVSFLCLNPKPESSFGILRLFIKVQPLTNTSQVPDLSGMSFLYASALCAALNVKTVYKFLMKSCKSKFIGKA